MSDKNKQPGDLNKKQLAHKWINASTITFKNIGVLSNTEELFSLVNNLIKQEKMPDEDVNITTDKLRDTITYEMVGKKLCLEIAHHVENAFKHYHPKVTIQNPKDNEFCRVSIMFEK